MTVTDNEKLVIAVLLDLLKEKELPPPLLTPDTMLEQIGLESLDFAQAVIRLEEITGKDPFAASTDHQIRTVSDLAVLYDGRIG